MLDEIIVKQHKKDSTTDAISILREQVDNGDLTVEELKDSIIEMLFKAYHGMFQLTLAKPACAH